MYYQQTPISGGPDPIPEDVRKKIEEYVKESGFHPYSAQAGNCREDVEFGYSLAKPEIERLRVALDKIEEVIFSEEVHEDPGQILYQIGSIVGTAITVVERKNEDEG